MDQRLLTSGEVAAMFRVNLKTVTRWVKTGRLTSIRTPGGKHRFRERDVIALLDQTAGDARPRPVHHDPRDGHPLLSSPDVAHVLRLRITVVHDHLAEHGVTPIHPFPGAGRHYRRDQVHALKNTTGND
ncbi:BldC family transcriptional regulator [Marinactinospora thermotolerans]|uniref:BldC family transcriptional regulator n=1 Tax=Marinactinospora thermotolerans TaxID=531310 RepID=UPI003D90C86F